MNQMISDQQYEQAKTFIQITIDKPQLSSESKDSLTELYISLTHNNGQEIYDKAYKIYSADMLAYNQAITSLCYKYTGTGLLIGSLLFIGANIGNKYLNKHNKTSYWHKFITMVKYGGGILAVLSAFGLFVNFMVDMGIGS